MFPFPGIVQFHVLVLSLWSMKNEFTPEKSSNSFTGSDNFQEQPNPALNVLSVFKFSV